MISAQGVVHESVFERYVNPKLEGYYWFVKTGVPNRAEYIFAGSPNSTKSEGMGGRVVPFKCTDGQTIEIQGPWWSNADAFLNSTGIDVTNEYLTRVIISKGHRYDSEEHQAYMTDVLYFEEEPVLGSFDRYKEVIQSIFDQYPELNEVYYMQQSSDGGCRTMARRGEPDRW